MYLQSQHDTELAIGGTLHFDSDSPRLAWNLGDVDAGRIGIEMAFNAFPWRHTFVGDDAMTWRNNMFSSVVEGPDKCINGLVWFILQLIIIKCVQAKVIVQRFESMV